MTDGPGSNVRRMKDLSRALSAAAAACLLATGAALANGTPAAKTAVVVIAASNVHASSQITGSCWTASIASQRSDAFRCMSGNEIHDPCFTLDAHSVACPASATSGIRIALTKPLPQANPPGKPNVWMMKLSGGIACNIGTGTVIPGYPFYCSGNLVCASPALKTGSQAAFVACGKPQTGVSVTGVSHYLVTAMYE